MLVFCFKVKKKTLLILFIVIYFKIFIVNYVIIFSVHNFLMKTKKKLNIHCINDKNNFFN